MKPNVGYERMGDCMDGSEVSLILSGSAEKWLQSFGDTAKKADLLVRVAECVPRIRHLGSRRFKKLRTHWCVCCSF